ncbi:OMD protein, partial [Polypterus senegalus]
MSALMKLSFCLFLLLAKMLCQDYEDEYTVYNEHDTWSDSESPVAHLPTFLYPSTNIFEYGDHYIQYTNECASECFCPPTYPYAMYCDNRKLKAIPNVPQHIRHLYIQFNDIETLSASAFVNATSLRDINLSNNKIRSSQVDRGLFAKMKNLAHLHLEHNYLVDIPAPLPSSLQRLFLGFNQISKISADAFQDLVNVTMLDLCGNKLTDSVFKGKILLKMKSLMQINLCHNKLKVMPELPASVMQLSLENNSISSIPEGYFKKIPNLMSLRLSYNKLQDLPYNIFNLSSLMELNLGYNQLSKTFFIPRSLEHLYLNDNEFLATLKRIDLSGNLIEEIEDGAFSKLPLLEELSLAENRLVKIPALPAKLTSLNMNHNRIKNKGIKANVFKKLNNLSYLYLANNELESVPSFLPETLRILHFQNNNITAVSDETFCKSNTTHYIRDKLDEISQALHYGSKMICYCFRGRAQVQTEDVNDCRKGIPVKTFGYLNITTTTVELHKCLSILNKTKWKGETLQIEMAKESFLQRLCEEQKQSVVAKQSFHSDTIPQFMESLKTAGVENFHMKAAVPGSEVPGHKYDPSKHCHGIKNFNQETDYNRFTPISKLTWFVEEGDEDISRKRRGEFPIPKKKRKGITEDIQRKNKSVDHVFFSDLKKRAENPSDVKGTSRAYSSNPVKAPNQRQENGSCPRFTNSTVHDSDIESEEEIKRVVAKENKKNGEEFYKANDDLEVVNSDFSIMYNSHNNDTNIGSLVKGLDRSRGYDSADTDEIITFNKANSVGQIKQKVEPAVPTTSRDVTKKTPSKEKSKKRQFEMRKAWSSMKYKTAETFCSSEDSKSSVDSDYEAMMNNSCRVDLTLTEMETLAKINETEDKVDFKWLHNDSVKKICTPEEILESLIADNSSEDESKWTKRNRVVQELPSFKGTRILSKTNESAQCYTEDSVTNFQRVSDVSQFGSEACKKQKKKIFYKDGIFHAKSSCEQREEVFVCNSVVSKDCQTIANSIVPSSGLLSSEFPGKGFKEKKQLACKKYYHSASTEETMPWSSCSPSSYNTNAEKLDVNSTMSKSSCFPPKKEIMSKSTMDTHSYLSQTMNPNVTSTVKQQQDNLRRMAALMQREKEASLQKTQIRLALSNLAEKKSHTKLFENTEDEENDKDDDDGRFQLKAHFEGKAGQKLMRLQSHFGTDERFRMDSRFLESEDEQDVAGKYSYCLGVSVLKIV